MSYARFTSPRQRLKPITRRPIPQVSLGLYSRGGSWGGRAQVRMALYMGAIVAARFNPAIRDFYQRLCVDGKAKKVAFWHGWHAYFSLWCVQGLLPLNICNLMVIASAWTLLSKNQVGYEFIYLLGIPAASQVLITPALGPYGFPHALFFQIFISHGGVVVASLYLTLVEGMRPASWRSVWRVRAWTTLYAVVIFVLNPILPSNYLFLAYKPPAATLLDYLGPWLWYFLSMEVIGLVLATSLYLPFHWADIRSRGRSLPP